MAGDIGRRDFLAITGGSAAAASGLVPTSGAAQTAKKYDVIIVGGGNAGLPAAIFAAQRGASVLVIEASGGLGGTLIMSSGQMSAAGTKLQKAKGIEDNPDIFYDDVMRISHNTADPVITRLAVDNSADTFDWLTDHGLEVWPDHPVTGTTHEPYSRRRYAWGLEGGISILNILMQQIEPLVESGKVEVLYGRKARELIQDGSGRVTGVVSVGDDGTILRHWASNVVLTSGGCASNTELYEKLEDISNYNDDSFPYSQGDGILLGLSAGGHIWGKNTHIPLFGGVLAEAEYPSPLLQIFRPWPPERHPFEIFVNVEGERFVREDVPSHDVIEQSLLKQTDTVCWIVFDEAMFEAAKPVMNPAIWSRDEYRAMFNNRPFFHMADTLPELARLAGFDEQAFAGTVASFNAGQASGKDAFERQHMPLPFAKAPYYAIKLHSWKYTSYSGLAVDGQLRVTTAEGQPVPGLYAAGEIIGNGSTMGRSVCGGMSVTPALTFGRLLGQTILDFPA